MPPLPKQAEMGVSEKCLLLPAPTPITQGPEGGRAPQGPPNISNFLSHPADTKVLREKLFLLGLQNRFPPKFSGPRKKQSLKANGLRHAQPALPVSLLPMPLRPTLEGLIDTGRRGPDPRRSLSQRVRQQQPGHPCGEGLLPNPAFSGWASAPLLLK